MKTTLPVLICLIPFLLFSQEKNKKNDLLGSVRFTNFQIDNRNVLLFDEADAIVDEVFLPEEGQGVIHKIVPGEYCAKVFIQPKKGDVRLVGLEDDKIYETEFSIFITSNKEKRILLQNITKHLLSKEVD